MLVEVTREFHVGGAVMFEAGIVELAADPIVKHGFFTDHRILQTIDVDRGSGKVVPVARRQRERSVERHRWFIGQLVRTGWVGEQRRAEGDEEQRHEKHAFVE